MDYYGMEDALKKSQEIANSTEGESVVDDTFGGKTFQPLEGGPEEFKRVSENNIYRPKQDY
jgi:hypothetical protein